MKSNMQNIITSGEAVKPSVRQLQEKKSVKHTIQNLYCLYISNNRYLNHINDNFATN